jgi:hypothetical protein
LREQITKTKEKASRLPADDPAAIRLLVEADRNEQGIKRLEAEAILNNHLTGLAEA